MARPNTYVGIDNDIQGGMTTIGKLIRDAWVFGLIPETETCEGWDHGQVDALLDKVNTEWDKYGCLVSHLPDDLRERHKRIHDAAVAAALADGLAGDVLHHPLWILELVKISHATILTRYVTSLVSNIISG